MATDVIILNRMYVGDYLGENIGHEVINLMKLLKVVLALCLIMKILKKENLINQYYLI